MRTELEILADRVVELEAEVERLRSVVAACHEAIGEDPGSDDDTLAEGIERLRAAVEP